MDFQDNLFVNANLTYDLVSCPAQLLSLGNCNFKNNLFYKCNTTAPWNTTYGNVNQGGNIINASSTGMLAAVQTALLNYTDDPTLNFSLIAGSLGSGTGTNGEDIGLLYRTTGSLNWTNSRNSRIPYIYNFNLLTPNVGPGQPIKFTLEARRNN